MYKVIQIIGDKRVGVESHCDPFQAARAVLVLSAHELKNDRTPKFVIEPHIELDWDLEKYNLARWAYDILNTTINLKLKPFPSFVSFMELAIKDQIEDNDLDGAIDRSIDDWHNYDDWHGESVYSLSLHEYLGMTWEEYSKFVEKPESLKDIVERRKNSK
jgi:hypothetical protein